MIYCGMGEPAEGIVNILQRGNDIIRAFRILSIPGQRDLGTEEGKPGGVTV